MVKGQSVLMFFFRKYTIHEERRKDMTTNEEKLKESLETRRPVLFLGAGFSLKATSGSGCPLMLGSELAKGLYNYVIKSQKDALVSDGADTEAI